MPQIVQASEPVAPVRPMIKFIKNQNRKSLVGVEIGTFSGINAYSILSTLDIRMLYLVDPYEDYAAYREQWLSAEAFFKMSFSEAENAAKKRLDKFSGQTTFLRERSVPAAAKIPDNLDFVYIDGNHEYIFVKSDINTYFPKLRPGGILGGHDYNRKHWPGVVKAAQEFAAHSHLPIQREKTDWWVVKP